MEALANRSQPTDRDSEDANRQCGLPLKGCASLGNFYAPIPVWSGTSLRMSTMANGPGLGHICPEWHAAFNAAEWRIIPSTYPKSREIIPSDRPPAGERGNTTFQLPQIVNRRVMPW